MKHFERELPDHIFQSQDVTPVAFAGYSLPRLCTLPGSMAKIRSNTKRLRGELTGPQTPKDLMMRQ